MTLIIGIKCRDGLVMAADSMSTESAPQGRDLITRHESNKLVIQKDLLWGASGSVGVKQLVHETIAQSYGSIVDRKKSAINLRKHLVEKIGPVVHAQYKLASDMSGGKGPIPHTNFVFGVHCENAFSLINVECDMGGEVVEATHVSTGSGAKTGQALLRRLRHQDWDVRTALRIAYRTMNDAIHVEPMGIGPPIRLARYTVAADGKPQIEMVGEQEMEEIRGAAEAWTGVEQEVLEKMLNPQPEAIDPPQIP